MLRLLAIVVLLTGLPAPATADVDRDFARGLAAYGQGDFAAARAAFEALGASDLRALFYLGRIHLHGEGVAANAPRAQALFERAAAAGEAAAMAALAAIHKDRGEPRQAFDWITRAATAGLPFAQAELGTFYEAGIGVAQSDRDAVIWYGRAARGGSAIGAIRLYRLGADADMDKHGSVDDVGRRLDRAHAGDSQARFELANLFGDVGAHDRAFEWYRLAADQGHHGAEYEVGFALLTGRGVARNEAGGAVWLRRAIGGGHALAMYQLANIYRFGLGGVDVHEGLALEWYENAVEDGYSAATHGVVEIYLARAGAAAIVGNRAASRAEIAEAIIWYERGVKLGDPEVSYAFARNLYEGFGSLTVADVPGALAVFEIAAQQGSLAAARDLARHFSGASVNEGRDADFRTVYFWNAVLEADDPDDAHGFGRAAAAKRAELTGTLTDSEIAAVMHRVAAWRAEYRSPPD